MEIDKDNFAHYPKLTKMYTDMRRTHIQTLHLDDQKPINSKKVDIIMKIKPPGQAELLKKIKFGYLKNRMIKSDYNLTEPFKLFEDK